MDSNTRILALMSGGVDSSVAAALVRERSSQVTGVTMKIWAGPPSTDKIPHHGCYGPEEEADIEDARRVAEKLGIPFHVIDLTREYQRVVLDYFSQEYSCGRTPNPCVRCNYRIKFGALIEKAREFGLEFDYIASGHYARVEYDADDQRYLLKKAIDRSKDQSYFLAFLSQKQLSQLFLPLGDLKKEEVRQIAARLGLAVADKPDSQNFISGNYSAVIQSGSGPGKIIDKEGKVLGQHQGIQNYTIGQRRGLSISSASPLYVIEIDPVRNTIIVGDKKDIYRQEFIASGMNWIAVPNLAAPTELNVKIRSSHKEAEARIVPVDADRVQVKFQEPQLAITPGQTAVFYRGDVVIGGGIIEKLPPSETL